MSDFFRQLIAQLSAIWQRLSLQQKIITTAIVAFTGFGLLTLLLFARGTPADSGMKVAYSNLEVEEAAQMTDLLKEGGYKYRLASNGSTIEVEGKKLYDVRMALAKAGLPKHKGVGYELFDKTNLGMTDYVQKLNARRALEGELQRTIEGLDEVEACRVHVVIPEPSIFLDAQKDPKASVVIKMKSGREMSRDQIRGIGNLVSSSVEGMKPDEVSIVDYEGKLLSNPYASDETALASSRNMELQQNVEKYLERKIENLLVGVLGPGKASVQIAADLDFDQVEKTLEKYDPESRVVRSEERNDENTKNAPDGDHQRERSLTNYEIDKTVEHVVQEVGNLKRLTIAVAVDGRYNKIQGKPVKGSPYEYVPRAPEEIQSLESMVKNAAGYDLARGDQIVVNNVQFDNEYLRREQDDMVNHEAWQFRLMIIKYVAVFVVAIILIFFLRYLAKTVAEAMNPPLPKIELLGPPEEVLAEVPEPVRKTNELLERVEMMTHEQPVNIASIIRQWLQEPVAKVKQGK